MIEIIEQFEEFLKQNGFTPVNSVVVADDNWHRAHHETDKKGQSSGSYCLSIEGDFGYGCVKPFKGDDLIPWHSKPDGQSTSTERRMLKDRAEEYKAAKAAEKLRKQKRIATLLTPAYKKLPKANKHPYLTKKQCEAHGVKIRPKTKELIIPIYGVDGLVWSIQKINVNGGKYLFKGGKKKGNYFPFIKQFDDVSIIILCEGFSTGASIREATGLPVAACIDSGNLKDALRRIADSYPSSQYLICADNDQFTFKNTKKPTDINPNEIDGDDPRWNDWREKGMLNNVGVVSGRDAIASVGGGFLIEPKFKKDDLKNKPTDFNDLMALYGVAEVKKQIMKVVSGIPEKVEPAALLDPTGIDQQQDGGGSSLEPISKDYEARMRAAGDLKMTFRCLGKYGEKNIYYSFRRKDTVELTPSAHNIKNLLLLDNLAAWQNKDEFTANGTIKCTTKDFEMYVMNVLTNICNQRGTINPDKTLRGAGVWNDNGRIVVNTGQRLIVDGVIKDIYEIDSKYTYVSMEEKIEIHKVQPFVKSESARLLDITKKVTWVSPSSAILLAGWIVIAPICGVLEYRPHIWITGESQSGKSTVRDKIIRAALGEFGMYADGGTTEASIREQIGYSTCPIVYDEAEASDIHTNNVMGLARLATSGGIVGKAGQSKKEIKFCICFSSISPAMEKTADRNRYSLLKLKKNKAHDAFKQYETLLELIEEVLTKSFSDRLIARSVEKMDVLLSAIKVFRKVVRNTINDDRGGQQIGTLVAGSWFLENDHAPTPEEAKAYIKDFEWKDQENINLESDPVKMINHITSTIVRFNVLGVTKEATLGTLIYQARTDEEIAKVVAMYGIKPEGDKVFIVPSDRNFKNLLRDTDWRANPSLMLENLDGTEKHKYKYISVSCRSSAISIPMNYFAPDDLRVDEPEEVEIPFDV